MLPNHWWRHLFLSSVPEAEKWPDLATEHIQQPKPVQPGHSCSSATAGALRPLLAEAPGPAQPPPERFRCRRRRRPPSPVWSGRRPPSPSPTPRSGERRSQADSLPQEVPRHTAADGSGPQGGGASTCQPTAEATLPRGASPDAARAPPPPAAPRPPPPTTAPRSPRPPGSGRRRRPNDT